MYFEALFITQFTASLATLNSQLLCEPWHCVSSGTWEGTQLNYFAADTITHTSGKRCSFELEDNYIESREDLGPIATGMHERQRV